MYGNTGISGGSAIKNMLDNAGDIISPSNLSVGKIPWRRKWQPTPVFLPGKSHREVGLYIVHGVAKCQHKVAAKQQWKWKCKLKN